MTRSIVRRRAADASAAEIFPAGSTITVEDEDASPTAHWRPGTAVPPRGEGIEPNAWNALRRHAEHAASLGIFADDSRGKEVA